MNIRTSIVLLCSAIILTGCYRQNITYNQANSQEIIPEYTDIHVDIDIKHFSGSIDYSSIINDPAINSALDYAMGPDKTAFTANLAHPMAPAKWNDAGFLLLSGRLKANSVNEAAMIAIKIKNNKIEVDAFNRHNGQADEYTTFGELIEAGKEFDNFKDSSFARFLTNGTRKSEFTWHQNGNSYLVEIGTEDCPRHYCD